MKIRIKYGVGYGEMAEEIITVEDGLTDDEIHGEVFDHICAEHLDFGWEPVLSDE